MHNVKVLLDALQAHLDSELSTPILRSRVRPSQTAPAIGMYMGSDSPDPQQGSFYQPVRRLIVRFDLLILSDRAEEMDDHILQEREALELAISKFEHPVVTMIWPHDITEPVTNADGEQIASITRFSLPLNYLEKQL